MDRVKRLASRAAVVTVTGLGLLWGGVAMAQETNPPAPGRLANAPSPVIGILLTLALVVVVVVISLMPSKRQSNQ